MILLLRRPYADIAMPRRRRRLFTLIDDSPMPFSPRLRPYASPAAAMIVADIIYATLTLTDAAEHTPRAKRAIRRVAALMRECSAARRGAIKIWRRGALLPPARHAQRYARDARRSPAYAATPRCLCRLFLPQLMLSCRVHELC